MLSVLAMRTLVLSERAASPRTFAPRTSNSTSVQFWPSALVSSGASYATCSTGTPFVTHGSSRAVSTWPTAISAVGAGCVVGCAHSHPLPMNCTCV